MTPFMRDSDSPLEAEERKARAERFAQDVRAGRVDPEVIAQYCVKVVALGSSKEGGEA